MYTYKLKEKVSNLQIVEQQRNVKFKLFYQWR